MLELSSVTPYLLARGLVSPASVLESDLTIVEAPHRNANYQIISKHGPCYLLKQGVGRDRESTVGREAAVYDFLGKGWGVETGRRYLPRCYLYDPEEHVLVIELWADAEDLRSRYQRTGRFSQRLAAELGEALAGLHRLPLDKWEAVAPGRAAALLHRAVLALHRPSLEQYSSFSSANLQLLGILQRFPEFGRALDALRLDWREEAFLHGDVKWSNILAVPAGRSGRPRLKVVDWEHAGLGDPCWDAGSVFGDYLSLWLQSIPITGKDPPDRFLELARFPLASMQPAILAFWSAYTLAMGFDPPTSARMLERALQYCAARLLQTAFDESFSAAEPTGNVICMLQVSLNILQRPLQAAIQLLGFPWQQVLAA